MNQYRCENCTKEDCWYFKMRDDSRTIKDKYGELLTPRSFTWEKGCASHSNFQSERDKVLDELDMYLDGELERASQFNAMGTFALLEVKRKIKGLRQKAGEP